MKRFIFFNGSECSASLVTAAGLDLISGMSLDWSDIKVLHEIHELSIAHIVACSGNKKSFH